MTLQNLVSRIGSEHVERRLKVEADHEAQLFGQGLLFFNLENWRLAPRLITWGLKFTGLYRRARRNGDEIVVRRTSLAFSNFPPAFDDFTILHLSDLHADISEGAMRRLASIVGALEYDMCVLTGDYRGKTYGPSENALQSLSDLRPLLNGPLYGILGNHDSVRMAPAMEALGIRMLFNEYEPIARGGSRIYLAGVDDACFYRAHDIEKAASGIPKNAFSILLSHTPEVYEQAAAAEFDLMLSGHTHGGQLCLPGGIPIKLEAVLPRSMAAGPWSLCRLSRYVTRRARASCPIRRHRGGHVAN